MGTRAIPSVVILTLAVGGGVIGAMAFGQPHGAVGYTLLRTEYLAHPRDIVNLVQGTPYTVPEGKILVIRDLAVSDVPQFVGDGFQISTRYIIRVDGTPVWEIGGGYFHTRGNGHYGGSGGWAWASTIAKGRDMALGPLNVGVVARANQSVEIESLYGLAYASGFLANE